jgi:hypothetical protein
MNMKTNKIFSFFWLIAGLVWTVATIRHIMVNDDNVGAIIYIVAAGISFVLAFVYRRNFVK